MPVEQSPLQQEIEAAFLSGKAPLELLAQQEDTQQINREEPDVDEPRKELVNKWSDRIKRAKKYWAPVFE